MTERARRENRYRNCTNIVCAATLLELAAGESKIQIGFAGGLDALVGTDPIPRPLEVVIDLRHTDGGDSSVDDVIKRLWEAIHPSRKSTALGSDGFMLRLGWNVFFKVVVRKAFVGEILTFPVLDQQFKEYQKKEETVVTALAKRRVECRKSG
jgi:hypothetical protein